MTTTTPQIDHAKYQRKVRNLSTESLRWTIKDCQEAIDALPDNPKNGYYQDEIHYCAQELTRRGHDKEPKAKRKIGMRPTEDVVLKCSNPECTNHEAHHLGIPAVYIRQWACAQCGDDYQVLAINGMNGMNGTEPANLGPTKGDQYRGPNGITIVLTANDKRVMIYDGTGIYKIDLPKFQEQIANKEYQLITD
jgi:hypothetical protein